MRDRYTVVAGLIMAAIVVAVVLDGGGGEEGPLGLDQRPALWPLPEFAVPDAAGPLEGDANVAQDDCESSRLPCPAGDRRRPACRLRTPGAIRVCDFFDRPAMISFWFSRGGNCVAEQDVVSRLQARYGDRVGFLSLNIRDDREAVREQIASRGWRMPVGYDRDGAVAALYRVGGCPTFAFAYPGGVLHSAAIGELDAAELGARVERLLRASRRRAGG